MRPSPLLVGLDRLCADPAPLRGKRIGLLVNPASVTSGFVPARTALVRAGLDVPLLFGPEHGLTAAAQDMIPVADSGGWEEVPVVSLYGKSFADLSPRPEHLAGLDAVVSDLQDAGSRYYTFVWTTALMMKACAKAGIPVFVLDQPNPLGGMTMEGNLVEEPLLSFIGLYPVPARHGMTPGEIARYVNEEFRLGCDLTVVPLTTASGLLASRERIGETGSWVLPSPNMPTCDTALVYPGACLVEGTNLSEGRGTTRPFELVGAPWIDPVKAADQANELGLPGVVFRPHIFRPTFHKHAGHDCGGVQLHVTDEEVFRPFETGLRVVKLLRDLDPERFSWRTEEYEFRSDVPAIDLLAGTGLYRRLVDEGKPLDEWIATFPADLARFAPARDKALIYRPAGAPVPTILVVGAHESGKTTVVLKLIEGLAARGLKVGSLKHAGHEHETDVAEKDSERHAAAGANPALFVAGGRTAVHRRADRASLAGLLEREMADVDVAVVEGFKAEPGFPKIEVVRRATGRAPMCENDPEVIAVVTDRPTGHPAPIPRFAFGEEGRLLDLLIRELRLEKR
jgi:molybdopterin-guanine dinucleotide biosynthesis protein MobB